MPRPLFILSARPHRRRIALAASMAAAWLVLVPAASAQTAITPAEADALLLRARQQVEAAETGAALRGLLALAPFYLQAAQAAQTDGRADPLRLRMASEALQRARRQLRQDDPRSAAVTMLDGLDQLRSAIPAAYLDNGRPTPLHGERMR